MTAGAGPSLPPGVAPAPEWTRARMGALGAILLAAAILRLALLPTQGLRDDLDLFASWIHRLATDVPLDRAYDLPLTFPPVMTYLFRLMGIVQPAFQAAVDASDPAVRAAIKLPASLADLGLVVVVVALLRDRPRVALAAGLAIAFVPATWYVSAWWGQFESIYTLFGLLAALAAIRNRWVLAGIALGLALSTKPQALPFIVPFAAWAVARLGLRGAIVPGAAVAATILAVWLPFLAASGPAAYLANVAALQGGDYAVLSIRAWNLWWIPQQLFGGGNYFGDGAPILGPITPRLLGYAMTGVASLVVFIAVVRRPSERALLLGLTAATLAAFLLLTTMHDRYSFPAVVFLLPLAAAGLVGASSPRGSGDSSSPSDGSRTLAVVWIVLVAAASANYVASSPPGGVPGSVIPIDGWVGLVGSVAMCAVGAVCLVALTPRRRVADA